jgi:hypothetical protein
LSGLTAVRFIPSFRPLPEVIYRINKEYAMTAKELLTAKLSAKREKLTQSDDSHPEACWLPTASGDMNEPFHDTEPGKPRSATR